MGWVICGENHRVVIGGRDMDGGAEWAANEFMGLDVKLKSG